MSSDALECIKDELERILIADYIDGEKVGDVASLMPADIISKMSSTCISLDKSCSDVLISDVKHEYLYGLTIHLKLYVEIESKLTDSAAHLFIEGIACVPPDVFSSLAIELIRASVMSDKKRLKRYLLSSELDV